MGIFDRSNAANSARPVDLVSRYQAGVARAAYSPSVAQAAARSGMNPTMATRIAAREVGQQTAQNLPGLLSQEAQMMEARRIENENKDKEALAMGLNIGGQVLGTVVNAYAPGAGSLVQGAAGAAAGAVGPQPVPQAQSMAVPPVVAPQGAAGLGNPRPAVTAAPQALVTMPSNAQASQIADQYVAQSGGINLQPVQLPYATATQAAPQQSYASQIVNQSAAGLPLSRVPDRSRRMPRSR